MRTTIQALRIEGTGFLAPFTLTFSDGLNCIIGARGTGKTSVLELIRFAAGRESDSELVESTVGQLVPAALGENGFVEVDLATPLGQELTVHRDVTGQWSAFDRSTRQVVEIEWPALGVYDLAIFSQNQLEEIATSPPARLATLDTFCGDEIDRVKSDIGDVQNKLQANAAQQAQIANRIESLRSQGEALPKLLVDLEAVEAQYQKALADLEGQETTKKRVQELSAQRQALSREEALLGGLLSQARDALLEPFPGRLLGDSLRQSLAEEVLAPMPDRDRLRELRLKVSRSSKRYAELREAMTVSLTEVRDAMLDVHGVIAGQLQRANREYQDQSAILGATSQAWKESAALRDSLLSQQRTLQSAALTVEQEKAQSLILQAERKLFLERLAELSQDRYELRTAAAAQLNAAIGGSVIVRVTQAGALEAYRDFLIESLRGSGMQYSRLIASVTRSVPPGRLSEMARRNEVEPLVSAASIDTDRARRLLLHLAEPTVASGLESVDVDDVVHFALKVSDDTYRESETLSQGQKCTTVLSLLLVDASDPLVIDQPEDNLDNAYVVDTVVDVISRQSHSRQFIFVTHNPNIPVLAEADLVIAMKAEDGKGSPDAVGRWNDPAVMSKIMAIMEGGREAFARRQVAYGGDVRKAARGQ